MESNKTNVALDCHATVGTFVNDDGKEITYTKYYITVDVYGDKQNIEVFPSDKTAKTILSAYCRQKEA